MNAGPDSSQQLGSRHTLPSGTVTFAFTDIEGSTQRWDRDRHGMEAAVRRHDALVRAALTANAGHVFKTIGDAFCAAFARPQDAVAAAIAAQRALAAEDFSSVDGLGVRIALHTGTADERDGDYFGPTLNRVARLLSTAHGGQTLLSNVSARLVADNLPPGASLRDLGPHRLRNISGTERIAQLEISGLRNDFPPLNARGEMQTNLQPQLTPLIGRDAVFADVRALLETQRLVTLTGSGGVGKTRVAHAVAMASVAAAPDGVWYVELANVSEPQLVAGVIADALSISVAAMRPIDALVAFLRERETLLVLDNCEHIIDAVAQLVDAILRACEGVRILATSREPLALSGEALYRIPSLAVPAGVDPSPEAALTYGAVALFVERARSAESSFRLSAADVPEITLICRRLDGIPLALELAAARISILSLRQLSTRLDERFRVLTNKSRTALPRHRTLHAMIDWSHDLLAADEQTLYRRLAVFRGAWTIDDAVAVCAGGELSDGAVFDAIFSLAQKSLVIESDTGPDRFRFLETTRAHAREKLLAAGEEHATAERLVARTLGFACSALEKIRTAADAEWLHAIEDELDNLRGALDWALGEGHDIAAGAQIAIAVAPFWRVRLTSEGRHWLRLLQGYVAMLPDLLAARVLVESIRIEPFDAGTLELAERAVGAYRAADDAAGLGVALQFLGQTLLNCGRYEAARKPLEEGLGLARQQRNTSDAVRLAVLLAFAEFWAKAITGEVAHERFREAERAARAARRDRDTAYALVGRSEVVATQGAHDRSVALVREALVLAEAIGDQVFAAVLHMDLAHALADIGDADDSVHEVVTALATLVDVHVPLAFAEAAIVAAAMLAERHKPEVAARLIGYAQTRLARETYKPRPRRRELLEQTSRRLQTECTALDSWLAKGAMMEDRQIVADVIQGFLPDG